MIVFVAFNRKDETKLKVWLQKVSIKYRNEMRTLHTVKSLVLQRQERVLFTL